MRTWSYSVDGKCIVIVYKKDKQWIVKIPDDANDIILNNNIRMRFYSNAPQKKPTIKTSIKQEWINRNFRFYYDTRCINRTLPDNVEFTYYSNNDNLLYGSITSLWQN